MNKSKWDCFIFGVIGFAFAGLIVGLLITVVGAISFSGYRSALADCERYATTEEHRNLCGGLKAEYRRKRNQ